VLVVAVDKKALGKIEQELAKVGLIIDGKVENFTKRFFRCIVNAMGQCMLFDKERDILGSLDVGEAVVKLQVRIARPFQVTTPEFIIEKGKITDTRTKEHM
jgi:hypothetical protein